MTAKALATSRYCRSSTANSTGADSVIICSADRIAVPTVRSSSASAPPCCNDTACSARCCTSGRRAWTVSGIERSRSASPTQGSRASATVARLMSTCSPAERRSATIDSQIAVLPTPASPVRITAAELAPLTPSAARIDKRSVARPMRSAASPATPLLRVQQSDLPGDLADAVPTSTPQHFSAGRSS